MSGVVLTDPATYGSGVSVREVQEIPGLSPPWTIPIGDVYILEVFESRWVFLLVKTIIHLVKSSRNETGKDDDLT